jgi:hypothetical protein
VRDKCVTRDTPKTYQILVLLFTASLTSKQALYKLFMDQNPQNRRIFDDFFSCDVTLEVTDMRVVYQLMRLDVVHNIFCSEFFSKKPQKVTFL